MYALRIFIFQSEITIASISLTQVSHLFHVEL
jgi:hypothetical protein